MLRQTLKMAFWVTYDHLGKLLVASFIWSLFVGPWLLIFLTTLMAADPAMILVIGLPAWAIGLGIAAPLAMVGMAHMVKEFIDTKDGAIRTIFKGMRLYGKRAIAIGIAYVVAIICLMTNVWFYGYSEVFAERAPWVGLLISIVAVWILVFLGLMAMFVMPALVQKRDGWFATLKLTALLVLDNPLLALGLGVQLITISIICLLIPPVLVFLHGGLMAVITGCAYEVLSRKYAAVEGQTGAGKAGSRHMETVGRGAAKSIDPDAEDDYLNRGFRDFLFPWKE